MNSSEREKKLCFVAEIDEIVSRNKFTTFKCTESVSNDIAESDRDSVSSTDSGDECVRATLNWINGNNSSNTKNRIDSYELSAISAGSQHQSRLEKLKSQPTRFPRPLKSESNNDGSNDLSDADMQRFERILKVPTGRRRLLNKAPMPSGHEVETHEFLKHNPNNLF